MITAYQRAYRRARKAHKAWEVACHERDMAYQNLGHLVSLGASPEFLADHIARAHAAERAEREAAKVADAACRVESDAIAEAIEAGLFPWLSRS